MPTDAAKIRALAACTFLPASAAKRFVRQMSERLEHAPDKPLTPKQAEYLATLFHTYRRQHRACDCAACQPARRSE